MKTTEKIAKGTLCNKGKHDLSDPKNVRYDKRGVRICRRCDAEYQKENKHRQAGILASLPPETPSIMKDYKEPLRAVVGGFGYLGTIAYDESQCYTQCHSCGHFFRHLGKHIANAHSMTSDEYKEKYGIEKKSSLLATNTRSSAVEHWATLSPEEKKKRLERLKEMGRRGNEAKKGKTRQARLEWYNKRGSCPDQIIDKILTLHKKFGKTPTQDQFIDAYNKSTYKATLVHFGSWREACVQAGLSPNSRGIGKPWYTREQLIESLVDFKKTYGREPYYGETRTGVLIASSVAYVREFGSWLNAKKEAFNES